MIINCSIMFGNISFAAQMNEHIDSICIECIVEYTDKSLYQHIHISKHLWQSQISTYRQHL